MDIAIGIIAAIIALGQAWFLRIQARQARMAMSNNVIEIWQKSIDSWRIIIAIAMGGTANFYAPSLTPDEEEKVTKLRTHIAKQPSLPFSREQLWLSDHCRIALGALNLIAELALTGKISPSDLYAVLGVDLARRSRPLRNILFNKQEIWPHVDSLHTQRGVRQRILSLIDLMWVEAARRDDLPPWTLNTVAELKRSGTGKKARERIRAQCTALKSGPITKWQLERALNYAERSDFEKRMPWS